MYSNIPLILRGYPQWVVWREETTETGRVTKLPYDAKTGRLASVTDASTWSNFDTALAATGNGWGLGFVLSAQDPFCFIDLDDPNALKADGTPKNTDPAKCSELQQEIFGRFKSYSEISPSGNGLHIICQGSVPTGRRRYSVELYSSERFMTMTGNVYSPTDITDCNADVQSLYEHLGGQPEVYTHAATFEDKDDDATILNRAYQAENGAKFYDLWQGDWQKHYESQSEADFALINILAFYTTSYFQIDRLFLQSGLGQRDKAKRDKYRAGMIQRSFDRMPPPVDMDGIRVALERSIMEKAPAVAEPGPVGHEKDDGEESTAEGNLAQGGAPGNPYLRGVPGAVGEIAKFIYKQSPRPVPEIALSAAIAVTAGIVGRAYNVSNTGLNQYILTLAPTGRGKEAITTGITALMNRVTSVGEGFGNCPGAREYLGPERISSGQALVKYVDKVSKSFVSLQGEFDSTLKQMNGRHASAALIALKQSLLQFYSRSGRGQVMQPTIYSDRDKNTSPINAPAVTIIGEGTPERFYELLDEGLVSDGLLPRFTIIEYNGPRPPFNPNHANVVPSPSLVQFMTQLAGYCLMLNQSDTVIDVAFDTGGKEVLDLFNVQVDHLINSAENDTIAELWNRAHLKALKMAGTVAVGCNPQLPVISHEVAEWAVAMVKYDTARLVSKFKRGDIGGGESKQLNLMEGALKRYLTIKTLPPAYKINPDLHRDKIVPYRFLQSACSPYAAYKNDRQGAIAAVKRNIQLLLDGGYIALVPSNQLIQYGRVQGNCYVVLDPSVLGG